LNNQKRKEKINLGMAGGDDSPAQDASTMSLWERRGRWKGKEERGR